MGGNGPPSSTPNSFNVFSSFHTSPFRMADVHEVVTIDDILQGAAGVRERSKAQEWLKQRREAQSTCASQGKEAAEMLFRDANLDMRVGANRRRKRADEDDASGIGQRVSETEALLCASPMTLPGALPVGWKVELRRRTSGSRSGAFDKFYYAPDGQKFRSYVSAMRYCKVQASVR